MVYAALAASLMAAMWLARPARGRWRAATKWLLAGLAVVSLLPDVSSGAWKGNIRVPTFFASGVYREYLRPGENTLVLPFGPGVAKAMLWQAGTHMYFRMAGGDTGCQVPDEFRRWPALYALVSSKPLPDFQGQFDAVLGAHQVGAVIVLSSAKGSRYWIQMLDNVFGVRPVKVGLVVVYPVPPGLLSAYRNAAPAPMKVTGQIYQCSASRFAKVSFPTALPAGVPVAQ